jgi:hypothetical protein
LVIEFASIVQTGPWIARIATTKTLLELKQPVCLFDGDQVVILVRITALVFVDVVDEQAVPRQGCVKLDFLAVFDQKIL